RRTRRVRHELCRADHHLGAGRRRRHARRAGRRLHPDPGADDVTRHEPRHRRQSRAGRAADVLRAGDALRAAAAARRADRGDADRVTRRVARRIARRRAKPPMSEPALDRPGGTPADGAVPLLRTRALGVRFGGVVAVDRVDLQVRDRELLCLIGPNGAGKSTLFKALTGQLRPSSGSVEFLGESIVGLQRHEIARRGIGIKTQVPSVFEGLSVHESVYLAVRAHDRGSSARARAARVEALLDELRLAPIAAHRLDALAHGQRQWVELAMVLATEPRLVLLDEPVAGMSDEETARTAELV